MPTDLQDLRERFSYATTAWQEIRQEARTDMRYVAGDPWDAKEKESRRKAGRPCLSLDELGQYVNQLINDIRQNKRAIRVTPLGNGANDDTARFRANLIRQIEYRSNAQQAYTTMFENAVQRSYGYLRISPQYVHARTLDQELMIEPLLNPDLVTADPDAVSPTGADMKYAFIHESWAIREFKKKYPGATIQDFNPDTRSVAPSWFQGSERVLVAEYWTVETTRDTLMFVTTGQGKEMRSQVMLKSVLMKQSPGVPMTVKELRATEVPKVTNYITNGVEILDTKSWPGQWIPLVACYGKVLYVDDGAGAKRTLMSLVRLARDPYMLYCYYRTCEAELVGMTPKFPYFTYTGQLSPAELLNLQKSLHEPVAVIQVKPTIEGLPPNTVLAFPQRQPYEPPIAGLEAGAEAARRAIQAAMGSTFLPTSAQRRNEKSGVALRRIEDSAQKGSFHFIDHYEESITRCAAILDDLIPFYYDTARDVTIRDDQDTASVVRINDTNANEHIDATAGLHDITLSTGPSQDSEREAASDFADTLVQNEHVFPLVADLAVKLKNLGPIGDAIAKRLAAMLPPQIQALEQQDGKPDPQQVQQQMAALQAESQQTKQLLQEALQKLQTDAVKQQGQADIKRMDLDFQRWKVDKDAETKIAVAELGAKVDRLTLFLEERARIGVRDDAHVDRQHEALQAGLDRAHDVGLQQMAQQHAAEQQQVAGDQAADQAAQQSATE